MFKSKLAGCAFLTQTICGVEGLLTCYWSKQAGWRILVEPINQLLNLIIHQSVDSLYLFLLFRGNWPLSFKLFNEISPSFISLFFFCCCSLVLDFCEVLHLFFEARDFIRHRCSAEPGKAWIHCQGPFSLSADVCLSRSLSGGPKGMNRQWWGAAIARLFILGSGPQVLNRRAMISSYSLSGYPRRPWSSQVFKNGRTADKTSIWINDGRFPVQVVLLDFHHLQQFFKAPILSYFKHKSLFGIDPCHLMSSEILAVIL